MERTLRDGDEVTLEDMEFKAIAAPSHRPDSLLFEFTEETGFPFLFTGDVIGLGGVGYCPEDQIDALYSLIYDKLINYPDETCIFHGHENGEKMLEFAVSIEPKNQMARDLKWGLKRTLLKARSVPGTPSCIHDEKLVNPFFRCNEASVKEKIGEQDPKKVFAELVRRNNAFFKRRWMKWIVCWMRGVYWNE